MAQGSSRPGDLRSGLNLEVKSCDDRLPSKATHSTNKNRREEQIEIEREAKDHIMSVQFGRWNFEGRPPKPDYIERVTATLAPYGPDSNESYSKGGITILYRAFQTTKESHREVQPHVSLSGAVITWDGRLDNRAGLISELFHSLSSNSTDVEIVSAAYERWGSDCFAQLIGDWAISIWNPGNRSLILAKDPIGVRHLYYSFDNTQVTWSTILDPLVLLAGKTFLICEEYIARWLAYIPAPQQTPYVGINAVPPSSAVFLGPGRRTITKYWDFDPAKRIRYHTDAEYEEHFRAVLATAVQRRLRSDRPVLAELSGGMDSSSIVCMADIVIAQSASETPGLGTISWYDDTYDDIEPDWNELPFITKVEQKRGRIGHHINIGALRDGGDSRRSQMRAFENHCLAVTPDCSNPLTELFKQYGAYMRSEGYRVTLSGFGGDDATGGGVPAPTPELQNLLARARFLRFAHQLNAWAVRMGRSRFLLLWEAIRGFFPFVALPNDMRRARWFCPGFVRRNRAALRPYAPRVKVFGPLRSFQDNIAALYFSQRRLADWTLHPDLLREVRFPYLDRDLLEFVYAAPREQLVRVGQRRSLMKRALVNIIPTELLKRRRKAFLPQPRSSEWPNPTTIGQQIVSGAIGIIDPNLFLEALQEADGMQDVPIDSLKKTLTLESWLRHLTTQGVLRNSISTQMLGESSSALVEETPSVCSIKRFS